MIRKIKIASGVEFEGFGGVPGFYDPARVEISTNPEFDHVQVAICVVDGDAAVFMTRAEARRVAFAILAAVDRVESVP